MQSLAWKVTFYNSISWLAKQDPTSNQKVSPSRSSLQLFFATNLRVWYYVDRKTGLKVKIIVNQAPKIEFMAKILQVNMKGVMTV